MDAFINIIILLTTICMARHNLGTNNDIKDALDDVDLRFGSIIDNLSKKETLPLLDKTASFFGFLAIIHFVILFLTLLLKVNNLSWLNYLILIISTTSIFWASIKWFTKHKEYALNNAVEYTKFISLIFIFPILDSLSGSETTVLFYKLINVILNSSNLQLPEANNPFLMSLIIFFFYESIIFLYWIISTLMFAPIATFAYFLVFLFIKVSLLINNKFNSNPLTGVCTLLFIIASLYQIFQPS